MKFMIILASMLFSLSALAIPMGPVMVGGEADMDACGGFGIATVTSTLFTTNASGYSEFKTINASQEVYFCDYQKTSDGEFYGVVFSEDGSDDCGVADSIEKKEPYSGSCKSGWANAEYLILIAG